MIECIFTLDYEIYGDGTGSLNELVHEPTERLRQVFEKWDARFVNYVEVAEFEMIETAGTDAAIELVKQQVADMHRAGYEIALHLHPQWYNARHADGRWQLDYTEYNLCTLSEKRIAEIVDRSLSFLGRMIGRPEFIPLSFRAGNWLFQPTQIAARELSRRGVRIDSSVFKGGVQRKHQLDYRPAMKNGYFWPFSSDVNRVDHEGAWLELPIYTDMVAPWKMTTSKRMGMGNSFGGSNGNLRSKLNRAADFLRFRYPLKFDFCRMTLAEMTSMLERIISKDREDPDSYKPIVAIGHSKDMTDLQTVDAFLAFLREKKISVATFEGVYERASQFAHAR